MSDAQQQRNAPDWASSLGIASSTANVATVVLLFLVGAAGALAFLSARSAEPFVLTIMGLLATLGTFFIFGIAAGHIRVGERTASTAIAAAMVENLPHTCLLTTPGGRILYANRMALDMLGHNELGDLGSLEEIFASSQKGPEALFRLLRAAQRRQPYSEDVCLPGVHRYASNPPWYRVTVTPSGHVDLPEHVGVSVVWSIEDITAERTSSEQALENLHAELSQYSTMPAGLLTCSADGSVEFMNRVLADQLGYDSSRALQPTRLADVLAQDDVQQLRSAVAAAGQDTTAIELDFHKADGERYPATCFVRSPFDSDNGSQATVLIVDRDLTDAKAPAIADIGLEFTSVLKSAPFGIAIINDNGTVISSNSSFEKLIVSDRNAVRDKPLDELVRQADINAGNQLSILLAGLATNKGPVQPIDVDHGPDGEFARRLYIQRLTRRDGNDAAAIVYVTDTTEERALGHKFAQSQKMEAVGKLAGGIAHDFNNVLTAIIGFSDLLLANHRPTDHAYKNLQNIRSSANHAAGLVKQLLAFSRRQTLEPEVLQLNEVVTDLSVLLNRLLGENIELKISSGRDLWPIKADLNQLNQVVVNLAVNARDAMPDGGRLTIKTRNIGERESRRLADVGVVLGQYVLIEVTDTGSGMPEDVMQKIFEPFFTTKDVGKGTGLGLSTVYGIIKQTGGYIFVDSELGQGTTFRVYLPHHFTSEAEVAVSKNQRNKSQSTRDLTGHGRVLVVEDEDAVRIFATEALRRQGYEVLQASDGLEALDVMEDNNHEVDIVVSDVKMPEMDGPTLFKELRNHNPELKFVFVSGYTDDAFTKTLDEDAEYTFLPKPYTLAQIAEVVKTRLNEE
ncbi:MAG: ATP-binding protein [Pseudomonadota bacterium]